jgi:hypothetical protein
MRLPVLQPTVAGETRRFTVLLIVLSVRLCPSFEANTKKKAVQPPLTLLEYLFDFRRINIYFLFCLTNSVRDLIFV